MSPWQVRVAIVVLGCAAACEVPAQQPPVPGGLLARSTWCRLEVVGGRIQLTEPRLGHKATLRAQSPDGAATEILAFSAMDVDFAALHYEYRDEDEHWSLEIEHSRQVLLQRRWRGDDGEVGMRYRQPAWGPVSLVLDDHSSTREIVAADFWRLMLAAPAACGEHLLPLLAVMRPDWQLAALGQRVEDALLATASTQPALDRKHLEALIDQLGDPDFRRRQAADRQLREMGQRIVSHLQRLDMAVLDTEQRSRVRQIQRRLRIRERDTPERVAAWLIDDPATWLSLLEREDSQRRVAAAGQLARLLERPLDFDPGAPDAERQRQLAGLKSGLGLDRPLLIGSPSAGTSRR